MQDLRMEVSLGHIINKNGLKSDPKNIQVIKYIYVLNIYIYIYICIYIYIYI